MIAQFRLLIPRESNLALIFVMLPMFEGEVRAALHPEQTARFCRGPLMTQPCAFWNTQAY